MPQVRARERATGVAAAGIVGRAGVLRVPRRLDLQPPAPGEEQAVARHAGGQHAVEQVDPRQRAAKQILRRPHAHQVARLVRRQQRRRVRDSLPHRRRLFADGKAAQRVAGKIQRRDLGGVALAQIFLQPALHDPEEAPARAMLVPEMPAALRPARGARQGLLVVLARRLRRRTFVEGHQHVAAELHLDLGRPLRRERLAAAVEVAAEHRSLLGDLALLRQRVDLETA